jgi:hypothetical protein
LHLWLLLYLRSLHLRLRLFSFLSIDHRRLSPLHLWLLLNLRSLHLRLRLFSFLPIDHRRLSPLHLWLLLNLRSLHLRLRLFSFLPIDNRRLSRARWSGSHRRLHPPDSRLIHNPNWRTGRHHTLAHLLDRRWGQRTPRILGERRLLPVERNRGRGRSCASHHGPAHHFGRRTCGAGRGVCPGAEHALPLRRDRWYGENLRGGKLRGRYSPHILRHAASSRETILRHRRNTVLILVYVPDVGDRGVIPAGGVVTVYAGGVDYRVGAVHPPKVTLAHLI